MLILVTLLCGHGVYRRPAIKSDRDRKLGSYSDSYSSSSRKNYCGIKIGEVSSRALRLCYRLSCAERSRSLLDDFFLDGRVKGGFPHRYDASDFKNYIHALNDRSQGVVFIKHRACSGPHFKLAFTSGKHRERCISLGCFGICERFT